MMFGWVKKVVRIKEWSDYDRSMSFFIYVKSLFKNLFILKDIDKHPPKDFSSVVDSYHLEKDELKQRASFFKKLTFLYLFIFFAICVYSFYMFYHTAYFVGFVVICMSLIALCLAFRYHFYLTLIQHQRLNLTLKDWVSLLFKR